MESNFLNQSFYEMTATNIILNRERMIVFLLRERQRQRYLPLILLFNIVLDIDILALAMGQKINKNHSNKKGKK